MAFIPHTANSVVSVTDVVSINAVDSSVGKVRIYNKGPADCFLQFTGGAAPAGTVIIPAGLLEVAEKLDGDEMQLICDSGQTATVYYTIGCEE